MKNDKNKNMDKIKTKTPKSIIFVMFILGVSVFLEAGALLFQFYKTGMLNISVLWRPIVLIIMLCICFSTNTNLTSKMLKSLAVLYGIVAVSDLTFFYLSVALQDWTEYAQQKCEEYPQESESSEQKTFEQCVKEIEDSRSHTDLDLVTSIIYSVMWLIFRSIITFLLCSLSNPKRSDQVKPISDNSREVTLEERRRSLNRAVTIGRIKVQR